MNTNFYSKTILFFVFVLLGVSLIGMAQTTVSVSGSVVDNNQMPLLGATILEKGTSNGVQADFDGNFILTVSDAYVTLIISYVGYETQEVKLNGETENLRITLAEDVAKLSEVIVVAYGEQKRTNVTGAISSVGADEIDGRPVTDFQNALQGQVAGLNITNSTGAPGGGTSVVIRGQGSLSGGSNPLYVVDGNIINTFIGNQGAGFTNPDPLSTINPADIESVTVLKDASAASIYGARGANGVILITTKRGKSGKPRFQFDTFSGFQQAWNQLDLLNSQQYQQVWNSARDNVDEPRIPSLDGTNITTNTDWQDEVLRTASINSFNFRASGGGEMTRYSSSVGYLNQEGIIMGTGLERFNLSINTDSETGRFKFGNSLNVSRTIYDKESINASQTILNWAIVSAPNVPVFDPNNIGGYAGPTLEDGEPTVNPVAVQDLVDNENTVNRILGSAYGEYEILDGLTFRVNAGFDYITFHDRLTVPEFELNQNQVPGFEDGSEVKEYRGENNSILLENTLNYKRSFGNHNLDIIAGYTAQETHFADMTARVLGQFTGGGLPVLSGSNNINTVRGIISETKTTSIIGRADYNYDSKYIAQFNFRRDGSSKFVGENRYANFISGSVGWNIGNEAFMEDSYISLLKLRASYGSLGNDAINANSARFALNQNATYVFGEDQSLSPGVGPLGTIQNSDLRWERQRQLNVGLDFGLNNNKFTMTLDYFEKTSVDLLLQIPVPGSTGFDNITLNAGEVVNKGLEVSANYQNFIGDDFRFNIGGNFTLLDNEVTALTEGLDFIQTSGFGQLSQAQRVRIEPGQSLRSFYGYQVEGIFQSQAEVDAAPDQSDLTAPGDFKYRDNNGDGVIDAEDQTFIGDAIPDITFGFNIGMNYKNWDFSAQFQGVAGNDIWSETKFFTQSYARTNNLSTTVLNAWTPENPSTTVPRAVPQTLSDNDRVSDFFIEDGSYLRLKNLQLGYTLREGFLEKIGITSTRIFFAGQNIFTIAGYSDVGFDPEVGSSGIDNVVYPQARTMTMGLTVKF